MSSWVVLTVRGRPAADYPLAVSDSRDPWQANADIAATLQDHGGVREVTTENSHVYARLEPKRSSAYVGVLDDVSVAAQDAAVVEANDTSDTGKAHYYPVQDSMVTGPSDQYQETQSEAGTPVGAVAAATITARHGIVCYDHLRRVKGSIDITETYLDKGRDIRALQQEVAGDE